MLASPSSRLGGAFQLLLFLSQLHCCCFVPLSLAGVLEVSTTGSVTPSVHSTSTPRGIDQSSLELQCQFLLAQGLANSTRRSYSSGQRKFNNFCTQLGKLHPSGSPCQTDEWTLCLFATFLAGSVHHYYQTLSLSGPFPSHRRRLPRPPGQLSPFTADHLRNQTDSRVTRSPASAYYK